ncbi:LacI family DNA-binding transcriptional regulator [Cohnella soli]|uniref:LacI family DNA-binding transcriptional regulator n=1 Tax=Cohnella soli TaxID=425005 RepID=A0ABW0HSW9_9BACL
MKATIYDVAREAGVSIATVSNAINGKGKISHKRRQEILHIMERLDYHPSVIASALTGKRTYTIGLLIPDISNPFFAEIARAVEDYGHEMGYSVIICSTDNQIERIERYVLLLEQKSVDGIIIGTGIEDTDSIERLLKKKVPIAMIARELPSAAVNTVVVDDFAGGEMAARHLLKQGHQTFAVLAESYKVSSSRERIRGFKQALVESKFELADSAIMICDYTLEDAKQKAVMLLQSDSPPSALFCCNDILAVGALQAAKESGIRIPEQLALVSFDNTILSRVTDPPLTSVAQPMEHMGRRVVEMIIEELKEPDVVRQRIVLQPELIVRASSVR